MNDARATLQAMLDVLGGGASSRVTDYLMPSLLGLLAGIIAVGLYRHDRDKQRSKFSFDDLLVDPVTGKTDPSRCILMGSWLVMSWVLLWLAMHDKLTEEFVLIYGGLYIAPFVTKVIRVPIQFLGGKLLAPPGGDDGDHKPAPAAPKEK